MILIALAGLCVVSVLLAGGNLGRLADLRVRGVWIPVLALAVQVVITVLARGGSPAAHRIAQLATYVALLGFLWVNRRLPGARIIGLGALSNALVITINGGVMPASRSAERISGLVMSAGFQNSTPVAHPTALFLGDIIPWPGPLPNVLSVGDLLIFAGLLVLLHRTCGRHAPRPIKLAPIAPESVDAAHRVDRAATRAVVRSAG